MASVEKRTDGRTGYVVRWRDEAGKQRKKSFAKKAPADRFRAEIEHSLNIGAYVDPVAGKITFRAYAEQWRAAQPHRPNTAANTKTQDPKRLAWRRQQGRSVDERHARNATRGGMMDLTTAESRAIRLAGELATLIEEIVGDGPNAEDDLREMYAAIHVVQRAVGFNAVARAHPDQYRELGKSLNFTPPTRNDMGKYDDSFPH